MEEQVEINWPVQRWKEEAERWKRQAYIAMWVASALGVALIVFGLKCA